MSDNVKREGRKPGNRGPRTIGTNVGQAILDAIDAKRREQAALLRRMAGER